VFSRPEVYFPSSVSKPVIALSTDPAYPPSRQIVYLSVSTPRALLVISSAGTLASTVSEYIKDSLDLHVQIPAVEMTPNGITGSPAGEQDILEPFQQYAQTPAGVVLGPDSPATLSFTSGSTGIPKGVKGRHYSLTHFFPWMGKRFGLDSSSKYTMLSGIAHDPIQRDSESPLGRADSSVHTPLSRRATACANRRRYRYTRTFGRVDGR
jgi:L-aminoadipate-semialdehyde dehydrogenase